MKCEIEWIDCKGNPTAHERLVRAESTLFGGDMRAPSVNRLVETFDIDAKAARRIGASP